MKRNNSLFGVFLILAGIFLLLERFQIIDGDIFLLLLGSTFIAAYFLKGRILGLLIPGAFLTWLGLYTIAIEQTYYPILADYSGGLLFLALGLAFCTIFIHTFVHNKSVTRYWPLYPALSLIIFALVVEFDFRFIPQIYLDYLRHYWPAVLIILGVIILLAAPRDNDKKDEAE